MDLVDIGLRVMDVIRVYRPYAKFIVQEIGGRCTYTVCVSMTMFYERDILSL